MTSDTLIEIDHVTFGYDASRSILNDVSLRFPRGKVTAILGGSGHAVGAFIGAFVFEFVKLYAAALLTGAWQLVLGIVLIVMVFVAPTGIFGLVERRLRPQGAKA